MEIHFLFPITSDVTLCGELMEELAVVTGIEKATCSRCRELIKEISRQTLLEVERKSVAAVA